MITGCIKTGCIVHFPDYGQTISADVFRVGHTLVIKTHPDQVGSDSSDPWNNNRTSELVVKSNNGQDEFWRPDIGVFAVPESECAWYGPHP